MNLKEQLDALLDATAFDSTGTKIGAVRQVYVDDSSGKVTFATVATGIFSADAIIPLHGARLLDNELHVDHTRDVVRDSPRPDHTEDALTPSQEVKLLEYYGIEAGADKTADRIAAEPNPQKDSATVPTKGDATAPQDRSPAPQSKAPAPQSKAPGPQGKASAQTTPTTRETSPVAAPTSSSKDDRDEKTPTTTKPSTSGGSGDSPKPAKSPGSAPASASQSASDDGRVQDGSGSRD